MKYYIKAALYILLPLLGLYLSLKAMFNQASLLEEGLLIVLLVLFLGVIIHTAAQGMKSTYKD